MCRFYVSLPSRPTRQDTNMPYALKPTHRILSPVLSCLTSVVTGDCTETKKHKMLRQRRGRGLSGLLTTRVSEACESLRDMPSSRKAGPKGSN